MIELAIGIGIGTFLTVQGRKFAMKFRLYRKHVEKQLKNAEMDEIYCNREYADPRKQPKNQLPKAVAKRSK